MFGKGRERVLPGVADISMEEGPEQGRDEKRILKMLAEHWQRTILSSLGV